MPCPVYLGHLITLNIQKGKAEMSFWPHNDIIFWCILLAGFEVRGANFHLRALCVRNIFWPSSFLNVFARTFPIGHLLSSFPGTSRPSVRRSATFCADQAVLGGGLLLTIGIGGPFDHIHICGITSRFLIEFHRLWYNWVVHPKRSKLSLTAKPRCWKD